MYSVKAVVSTTHASTGSFWAIASVLLRISGVTNLLQYLLIHSWFSPQRVLNAGTRDDRRTNHTASLTVRLQPTWCIVACGVAGSKSRYFPYREMLSVSASSLLTTSESPTCRSTQLASSQIAICLLIGVNPKSIVTNEKL